MNFHLPDYSDSECKVFLTFYTAKPNRIDLKMDGILRLPTNAKYSGTGNEVEWERPRRDIHLPSLHGDNSDTGDNFFDRQEQAVHMILETGHIYSLEVKSTLILELEFMTELTIDQFYDNGDIAKNIAALLGISPSRIKIVNVIRETSSQRRKRRELSGLYYTTIRSGRAADDSTSSNLQFEVAPETTARKRRETEEEYDERTQLEIAELNKIGQNLAEFGTAAENPIAAATVSAIIKDDPSAEMGEMAVGQAEPLKTDADLPEWFDAENPLGESILQKAGLSEEDLGADEAGGLDFEELKRQLLAKTGIQLESLKTAEETANEKQETLDKATKAIVYKTPTTMVITSQPTAFQLEETPFSQEFVIKMLDQDGEEMETVGFSSNPATVVISLTDGLTGKVDGAVEVAFAAGDGRAIFDNVFVNNTDATVSFTFTANFGDFVMDVIPDPIVSENIEILENTSGGTCEPVEGTGFDKQEMWDGTCSRICTLPCETFGNLINPTPTCMTRETSECGAFSACTDSGCDCDLDAMPRSHLLDPAQYVQHSCGPSGMAVKINKCVMHKFGFRLEDLAINGIDPEYDGPLKSSDVNTCLGKLDYSDGSDYTFIMIGADDCGTVKTFTDTHVTYENAVRGTFGIETNTITRTINMMAKFSCTFETSIEISALIGNVGTKHVELNLDEVAGEFDVNMALFTDESFTNQVDGDFVVNVPDSIHIGVNVDVLNDRFNLELTNCFITPTNDVNDETKYEIISDKCVSQGVSFKISINFGQQ